MDPHFSYHQLHGSIAGIPVDQRTHDGRYVWGNSACGPAPSHSAVAPLLAASGQPFSRLSPYAEAMYHSLHSSPSALSALRFSPEFASSASAAQASDYLTLINHHSRIVAAHQVQATLAAQSSAAAAAENAALLAAYNSAQAQEALFRSPSAGAVHGRKRPLSSSPYSDTFDINSMIRFSPNSLTSIMNASRSSSATGSYGHLSAGAMSPSLSIPAAVGVGVLHPLSHLMRSPTLIPPALHSSASSLSGQHSAFSHYPASHLPSSLSKREAADAAASGYQRETASNVVSSTVDDERNKGRAEAGAGAAGKSASAAAANDDDDKDNDEPGDLIETNCKWENCCREFGTQEELVKHLKEDHIENNKKSFICCWRDCSRERKPFKAQYMLVVHMRRHTGEKPHRCTFEGCSKAYSRLENQKTHLRSHTGEKPYNCEYPGCAKAFTNASDRAKHQNRTHSNDKPYACKIPDCNKRYTDPSSLRKHVKTVHGAEAYANKKHKGHDRRNPDDDESDRKRHPVSPAIKQEHTLSPLSSPPVTSPSTSSPSGEENMRSPDASGGDADTAMEQMQNLHMDAPISDNSVSTTCTGPSGVEAPVEWCVDGVSVEEDYSSSDLMPPHVVAVGVGGSFYETVTTAAAVNVKSGKSSIKSRIKSGVKSATSWIPKVFGHKGSQVVVGGGSSQNPKSDMSGTRSSKKEIQKPAFVRQGSTSSSVSAYSSLACSVSGSHTSTSYTTSGAAVTASSQMTRCASYDPIYLSSRRSSTSSITTSSESPATASSQCKARHLSQTTNLIVQPQSVALSSAISSEGYGSSLSTLNSSSSLPFAGSSVEPVRSDTGSGSNSTTTTVTTQIHHPNENVVLDECDSDQPIEFNHNLILPDDVMRYLKESSESKPAEESKASSETSLPHPPPPHPVPNLMPPGPLSPNSSVTQPSPSSVMATAAPFDSRLTNLSNYSVGTDQPPFSPMHVDAVVTPAANPVTTSFGVDSDETHSKVTAAAAPPAQPPPPPPPYPQTQPPYHPQHDLQLQQQQQHQHQQQFLRQQQSQWQQQQAQNFYPANLFQVPNQIQMQQYAARSQAMTGTSHGVHGYSSSSHEAVSYHNYMQQQQQQPGASRQTDQSRHQETAAMPHHAAAVFANRSHNPSGTSYPQNYPHAPHDNRAAYCFGMSHRMDSFYNNHMMHPSPHGNNPGTSGGSLVHANMVVNDLSTTQAALIEETSRFLKHQQIPG